MERIKMQITPKYKLDLARELRAKQTSAERVLWERLRRNSLSGLGFRRQHPIGRFVADFCCESARLIVEVDGGYHDSEEQKTLDAERSAHFIGRGYQIVRCTNEEVTYNLDLVLSRIIHAAERLSTETLTSIPVSPLPSAGEGSGVGAK